MTDKEDLKKIREIRISQILGVQDNGRRYSIRCAFHGGGREKTPSCYVFPDGGYKCFGCGAHGHNAIDFVMGLGVSFAEAIEELKKYVVVK